MAIEVRQITIRSVVGGAQAEPATPANPDPERMREEILSECRRMVLDVIRAERER
jgi:hypothetical protein